MINIFSRLTNNALTAVKTSTLPAATPLQNFRGSWTDQMPYLQESNSNFKRPNHAYKTSHMARKFILKLFIEYILLFLILLIVIALFKQQMNLRNIRRRLKDPQWHSRVTWELGIR